jgi:hypothetical protein
MKDHLVFLLVFAVVCLLFFFDPWQAPWNFLLTHGVAVLWVVSLVLVIGLLLLGLRLKLVVLRASPGELEIEACKPEEFTYLDLDKLSEFTESLERLGFARAFDFKSKVLSVLGFGRLLIHPGAQCYATISQLFLRGLPKPMRISGNHVAGRRLVIEHHANRTNSFPVRSAAAKATVALYSECESRATPREPPGMEKRSYGGPGVNGPGRLHD